MSIRRLPVSSPTWNLTSGVAIVGLLFAVGGCGRSRPRNVLVAGSITLDGKPVAGCNIAFHPADGGRPAVGMSDWLGRYELSTQKKGDGAPPGRYQISVNLFRSVRPDRDKSPTGTNRTTHITESPPPAEFVWVVPKRYSDPATSGLSIEIPECASTEISFELKSN